jgi:hypothetical protein
VCLTSSHASYLASTSCSDSLPYRVLSPSVSSLLERVHLSHRNSKCCLVSTSLVQCTHLISTAARCEISVGRSSPSYHLTGTVTETLCPAGPAQTQNPSFIMLPAHNFSRVTPCTFLLLLLSQGYDYLFHSTKACRTPCFVSCALTSGFFTPFLEGLLGLRNRVHATIKSRDLVCFFPLFCSRAGKCNLSFCRLHTRHLPALSNKSAGRDWPDALGRVGVAACCSFPLPTLFPQQRAAL